MSLHASCCAAAQGAAPRQGLPKQAYQILVRRWALRHCASLRLCALLPGCCCVYRLPLVSGGRVRCALEASLCRPCHPSSPSGLPLPRGLQQSSLQQPLAHSISALHRSSSTRHPRTLPSPRCCCAPSSPRSLARCRNLPSPASSDPPLATTRLGLGLPSFRRSQPGWPPAATRR